MALVLTLRKGHRFFVGGVELSVDATDKMPHYFTLRRRGNRLFDVGHNWIFVALGVRVRLGLSRSRSPKTVSLVIDAPGLVISRGASPN